MAVDAINEYGIGLEEVIRMAGAHTGVCVVGDDLSYQWLDPRIRLGRGVS